VANTTETLTYFSGARKASARVILLSDGSTTTQNTLVDISTFQGTPTKVTILEAVATVRNMDYLYVKWDHDTDDEAIVFPEGTTVFTAEREGGMTDPASTGGTGDILGFVVGPAANGSAVIDFKLLLQD